MPFYPTQWILGGYRAFVKSRSGHCGFFLLSYDYDYTKLITPFNASKIMFRLGFSNVNVFF